MNLLKNIPDGMYYYEYVLLLLGIVLFFVLLILLIIYAIQRRSFKTLLPAFLFPIIMIGYPGFQKISYENGIITMEKNSRQLASNPKDSVARNDLKSSLDKVESRPSRNPGTLVNIGKGYAAIGDTIKAIDVVDKAVAVDPGAIEAKQLKTLWNTPGIRIERLTKKVETEPSNTEAKKELVHEISILEKSSQPSSNLAVKMVKALAVMKDTTRVLKYIDSIKVKTPVEQQQLNKIKRQFRR